MSSCGQRRSLVVGMIRNPRKSCWKSPRIDALFNLPLRVFWPSRKPVAARQDSRPMFHSLLPRPFQASLHFMNAIRVEEHGGPEYRRASSFRNNLPLMLPQHLHGVVGLQARPFEPF